MKVLHIISGFTAGGAEVFVKNLAIGLKPNGIESMLCAMDDSPPPASEQHRFQQRFIGELQANDIAWGWIGSRARKDPLWAVKRTRQVLAAYDPGLIHTHLTYGAVYACLATRSKPVIFTHHSTPVRSTLAHKLFLKDRLSRYIAISVSSKDALLHQARVKPEKIAVAFNGVNLELFRNSTGLERGSGPVTITAVGRLAREKNYPLLLTAMAGLMRACRHESLAPPLLQIIGEGGDRSSLERLCHDLELDSHVRFLGTRTDVPRLLQASDIFVMSSAWEGLSIALIEALAAGLPIVATDVGGNREIVDGACGFLTEPGNAQELSCRLLQLVRDRELRSSFSSAARRRATLFAIDRSIAVHAEIYRDVISRSSC